MIIQHDAILLDGTSSSRFAIISGRGFTDGGRAVMATFGAGPGMMDCASFSFTFLGTGRPVGWLATLAPHSGYPDRPIASSRAFATRVVRAPHTKSTFGWLMRAP
ncbi:envelope glycoprotein [Anopheles sinensis]|uniref:Envelope glycoprotein n=1 Tax=Anopheles sinensis TaxID=74873 RepID=A0A084VYT9_ANOSI|nr:envelope glycoprotein [Anopheles sinensis]